MKKGSSGTKKKNTNNKIFSQKMEEGKEHRFKNQNLLKLIMEDFIFLMYSFCFHFLIQVLKNVNDVKEEKGEKIENYVSQENFNILKLEHEAIIKNERLRTFGITLLQSFTYYLLSSQKRNCKNLIQD